MVSLTTGVYPTFFRYDYNIGPVKPATNVYPAFMETDPFCKIFKYSISTMWRANAVSPIASVDPTDDF